MQRPQIQRPPVQVNPSRRGCPMTVCLHAGDSSPRPRSKVPRRFARQGSPTEGDPERHSRDLTPYGGKTIRGTSSPRGSRARTRSGGSRRLPQSPSGRRRTARPRDRATSASRLRRCRRRNRARDAPREAGKTPPRGASRTEDRQASRSGAPCGNRPGGMREGMQEGEKRKKRTTKRCDSAASSGGQDPATRRARRGRRKREGRGCWGAGSRTTRPAARGSIHAGPEEPARPWADRLRSLQGLHRARWLASACASDAEISRSRCA